MGTNLRVSKNNTTIKSADGWTVVTLHGTDVVKFNDKEIILNTGGWKTVTTKARMNQVSNQFGLGYSVYQEDGTWYVCHGYDGNGQYKHNDIEFTGNVFTFQRGA